MTPFGEDAAPLLLPHLEETDAGPIFLGKPVSLAEDDLAVLRRCDGTRRLRSFTGAERDVVVAAGRDGLIVLAPPDALGPRPEVSVATVSPHPDDAILSVGALLRRLGRTAVLNVFSDETWTWRPYYAQRNDLTRRLILEEERIACTVVGSTPSFLGFVDTGSRERGNDGYFGAAATEDTELRETLVTTLRRELDGFAAVLAPLGAGGHVDHLHCREAIVELVADGSLDPGRVAFYDDLPYAAFEATPEIAGRLAASAPGRALPPLQPAIVPCDGRGVEVKREALRAYRIQLTAAIGRRALRYSPGGDGEHAERLWSFGSLPDLLAQVV